MGGASPSLSSPAGGAGSHTDSSSTAELSDRNLEGFWRGGGLVSLHQNMASLDKRDLVRGGGAPVFTALH